jgi:uncharacterized membrane protein
MSSWVEFATALVVFFASHAVPTRPAVKGRLVAVLGSAGFTLAYSVLSTAVLAWLIVAAGRAPYVQLWLPAAWQAWGPALAMPLACLLLAHAIGQPNPLSFGGARPERFDPERPGIAGVARHPLLLALALWAGAHLLPNGDLAHGLLFGLFLGFSLLGMALIDRRKRRQMGEADWSRLAARTSLWPLAALITGRWHPTLAPDFPRLIAAAALYGALLWLHPPLIGVSAWPL